MYLGRFVGKYSEMEAVAIEITGKTSADHREFCEYVNDSRFNFSDTYVGDVYITYVDGDTNQYPSKDEFYNSFDPLATVESVGEAGTPLVLNIQEYTPKVEGVRAVQIKEISTPVADALRAESRHIFVNASNGHICVSMKDGSIVSLQHGVFVVFHGDGSVTVEDEEEFDKKYGRP